MDNPDISVLVASHNQERYLESTFASIDNQQTEYSVEVIVADDASTDSSVRIAHDWKSRSSFEVRVLEPEPRLGITRNYRRGFEACSGRYIAVLEGDDEWLASDKLHVQAKYLDANEDVVVAANRLLTFNEATRDAAVWPTVRTREFATRLDAAQLAEFNWFGTFSACMLRTAALRTIPPRVFDEVAYDWMVNLAVLASGPGAVLANVATLYRSHAHGAWSGRSQHERDLALQELLPTYMDLLDGRLSRQLDRALAAVERRLAEQPAPPPVPNRRSVTPTKLTRPRFPLPRTTGGENPLVSVVAVYRGKSTLEAISTVLEQNFANLEVIVVHPDSAAAGAHQWKNLSDPRIRHYPLTQNPGEANALNLAIHQARGDYIAVIDTRDTWERTKLARQLERFAENPRLGAVFTGARVVDENGRPLSPQRIPSWKDLHRQPNRSQGQWLRHFMSEGNPLCHSSVLLRRDVLDEIGLYDGTLAELHDFDRWIALVKRYPIEVLGDEPLVRVRTVESIGRDDSSRSVAAYHENIVVNQRMFDGVTSQLLVEGFSDVLRSTFLSTPLEIDCATALLWLDVAGSRQQLNYGQALADIRRLLLAPDGELHLTSQFDLTPASIHELARHIDGAQTIAALNSLRLLRLTPERQPARPTLATRISGAVSTLREIPLRKWPRQITRRLRATRGG